MLVKACNRFKVHIFNIIDAKHVKFEKQKSIIYSMNCWLCEYWLEENYSCPQFHDMFGWFSTSLSPIAGIVGQSLTSCSIDWQLEHCSM